MVGKVANASVSNGDQTTYEPFGMTKSYFRALIVCDVSLKSLAAKVTFFAAPIIALITLFADLVFALVNCLSTQTAQVKDSPLPITPSPDSPQSVQAAPFSFSYFPAVEGEINLDSKINQESHPADLAISASQNETGSDDLNDANTEPVSPSRYHLSDLQSDDEGEDSVYYSGQEDNGQPSRKLTDA